jgi:hypothetical protein
MHLHPTSFVEQKNENRLIKLKEPVRQHRLFQLLLRRRRELNFITHLQIMLDASPTPPTRLRNELYEPFLRRTSVFAANDLAFILKNLYCIFTEIQQAHDMLRLYS